MQAAKKMIFDQLSGIYEKKEVESLSMLIFEKVLGLTRIQVHLRHNETIAAANLVQIKEIINRLAQFEPIQYIFGETEFYGCVFKVNPSVLIPRPETEELVDWIINDYKHLSPAILDIGTGSGCIPISLVKNLQGASAEGWDISISALHVASENARANTANVNFQCVDILNLTDLPSRVEYDILVSNPPYVTTVDKELMQKNVTHFEPHIALFVPDSDPLIFYRKIAEMATKYLKIGGHLYLEINEKSGIEMIDLLFSKGFTNITQRKDINGKDRMIRCEKPNLITEHN